MRNGIGYVKRSQCKIYTLVYYENSEYLKYNCQYLPRRLDQLFLVDILDRFPFLLWFYCSSMKNVFRSFCKCNVIPSGPVWLNWILSYTWCSPNSQLDWTVQYERLFMNTAFILYVWTTFLFTLWKLFCV